jgi:hypothetical protein
MWARQEGFAPKSAKMQHHRFSEEVLKSWRHPRLLSVWIACCSVSSF